MDKLNRLQSITTCPFYSDSVMEHTPGGDFPNQCPGHQNRPWIPGGYHLTRGSKSFPLGNLGLNPLKTKAIEPAAINIPRKPSNWGIEYAN